MISIMTTIKGIPPSKVQNVRGLISISPNIFMATLFFAIPCDQQLGGTQNNGEPLLKCSLTCQEHS